MLLSNFGLDIWTPFNTEGRCYDSAKLPEFTIVPNTKLGTVLGTDFIVF